MSGRCAKTAVNFILVLFLFFGFSELHGQEEQADESKQLREDILAAYQSGGEQGLIEFFKKEKDKITCEFIADFAEAGKKEGKEVWLSISLLLAKEKKHEKSLADVLLLMGEHFIFMSDYNKAADYISKAFPLYQKINDLVGQGNVYLARGDIHFNTGNHRTSLSIYNKALTLFKETKSHDGQAHAYWNKGIVYLKIGELPIAHEMCNKAIQLYKKVGNSTGQGNAYHSKGDIYLESGDYSRALKMYDRALIFYKKSGKPIALGITHLSKGDVYFDIGYNASALKSYDNALLYFIKAKENIGQGIAYTGKGDIYSRLGKNSKAIEMYDKAIHLFKAAEYPQGLGDSYLGKGEIYSIIGENTRALEMYDKALSFYETSGDPSGVGNVYSNKGDIYFYTGNIKEALLMCDKALLFFDSDENYIGQGNVYGNKGKIYFRIGDYIKAFDMLDKALHLFESAKDLLGMGNIYCDKGEIYLRTGNFIKALEMLNQALPLYEKIEDSLSLGNVYWGKGEVYLNIGDFNRAHYMCNKALLFYEKVEDPYGQGNVNWTKGEIYLKSGYYSKALELHEKAMFFYEKSENLWGQGIIYWSKGDIYFQTGKYLNALEMYEKALELYKEIGETESESNTLHGKAKVFTELGRKNAALALYEKAISKLEKLREQTPTPELKISLISFAYKQYEETVLFMLENQYDEKGFKYAEAMRARVFLDQLAEGLVRLDKGLAPDSKEKRDELVTKLSQLSKGMQNTPGRTNENKLQELKNHYRKIEDQFQELLIKIRLENPLYSSVRYPQPIPVQELQKEILKKDEILVRYFISPDKLYVFLVSQDSFKVIPLEINQKRLNWTVETYWLALIENNASHIRRYGKILYEKIFKPLEPVIKNSKNVIIIPDGQLATIPFESFIIDKKESGESLFLLEKYRLKYIQSASILSVLRKNYRRDIETNRFIGFGDPVYDYKNFSLGKREKGASSQNDKTKDEIKEIHRDRYTKKGGILNRLEPSGEEVEEIARLFREKSQEGKILLRQHASEENAKMLYLKDFDYIHFSCHGLLNDDFQSLVLSQDIPGAKEDGYFTLNEIMNCDYNARLVVLSACRTGSGKMQGGEGVTGMTRAVMYAGTPSVVASLWEVDATASKELMVKFYENMLEKNLDKSEALRQAKLELINNKKYRSPLFWSAFVLYGE